MPVVGWQDTYTPDQSTCSFLEQIPHPSHGACTAARQELGTHVKILILDFAHPVPLIGSWYQMAIFLVQCEVWLHPAIHSHPVWIDSSMMFLLSGFLHAKGIGSLCFRPTIDLMACYSRRLWCCAYWAQRWSRETLTIARWSNRW